MIQMLRRMKEKRNYSDEKYREVVGVMSSVVGVLCNLVLFIAKLSVGLMANSIAIISDSFNNLSDCAANVITFLGYKLAARPADKDHPFGHGRYEYLTALIISIFVLFVGVELLSGSVDKIINPTSVHFSWLTLFVLIGSIGIKLWLALFYRKGAKEISSTVLSATSQDSLNDCVSTAASVLALVVSGMTTMPVDGVIGVLVSLFIFYSGIKLIKETVDELLGKSASPEIYRKIEDMLMVNQMIIGVHDLMIHDYGPGKLFGSAHVEVSADEPFLIAHDHVDSLERKIQSELGILMTLHLDPIEVNNQEVNAFKDKVVELLQKINAELTIHDFRAVIGHTHTNLVFDIVVPETCRLPHATIKKELDDKLNQHYETTIYTVINFDIHYHG